MVGQPSFSCFLCLLSKFLQDLVYVLFAECEYMAENADRDFLDLLAGIEFCNKAIGFVAL